MGDLTQHPCDLSKQSAELFQEWVDYDAEHEALSPLDGTNEFCASNPTSTTTSPTDTNTNVNESPSQLYLEWLDTLPTPQQQQATGSGNPSDIKRLSDKRREQNRASQRAYRDRQKMLVDGLTTKIREMAAELEQQKTKCEALETACKHLATENDVYRTFLKLEKRPR